MRLLVSVVMGALPENRTFLYSPSNAELEAFRKFDLALWAFHGCPPLWNVEEGGLLKALGPAKTPHDGMNND